MELFAQSLDKKDLVGAGIMLIVSYHAEELWYLFFFSNFIERQSSVFLKKAIYPLAPLQFGYLLGLVSCSSSIKE